MNRCTETVLIVLIAAHPFASEYAEHRPAAARSNMGYWDELVLPRLSVCFDEDQLCSNGGHGQINVNDRTLVCNQLSTIFIDGRPPRFVI